MIGGLLLRPRHHVHRRPSQPLGQFEQPLGTISAASVVISIPLILLVLFFQKRIVAGLTSGAVKG